MLWYTMRLFFTWGYRCVYIKPLATLKTSKQNQTTCVLRTKNCVNVMTGALDFRFKKECCRSIRKEYLDLTEIYLEQKQHEEFFCLKGCNRHWICIESVTVHVGYNHLLSFKRDFTVNIWHINASSPSETLPEPLNVVLFPQRSLSSSLTFQKGEIVVTFVVTVSNNKTLPFSPCFWKRNEEFS